MTTVAEAEALIAARMPRRPTERIGIGDATGRVLAEAIASDRDQPPFDRVTMDGIAVASRSFANGRRSFRVEAVQAAGAPPSALGSPEGCIRVMTGAVMPGGADAVIPIERVRIEDHVAQVDESASVEAGRFVHARGGDRRKGDIVLEAGIRLGPAEIAVLASAGRSEIGVASLPRIAVVSTGDELVAVDAPAIEPWQIRSSNDLAIAASLARAGFGNVSRVMLRDDAERIVASLAELHDASDVLILSGGVSMGEFDYVPAALERLGAELVFHRIEQKPGRPMWFGMSAAGNPIFALPGNPVSTVLCMTRYVVPALLRALGYAAPAPEYARLTADVDGPKHLTYFVPAILGWDATGAETAEPRPTNTSGDFSALATTDGFLELAPGRHQAGTIGRVFRW
jgi:molybdopterin molybdotransferase